MAATDSPAHSSIWVTCHAHARTAADRLLDVDGEYLDATIQRHVGVAVVRGLGSVLTAATSNQPGGRNAAVLQIPNDGQGSLRAELIVVGKSAFEIGSESVWPKIRMSLSE